jgi:hypothetical protein
MNFGWAVRAHDCQWSAAPLLSQNAEGFMNRSRDNRSTLRDKAGPISPATALGMPTGSVVTRDLSPGMAFARASRRFGYSPSGRSIQTKAPVRFPGARYERQRPLSFTTRVSKRRSVRGPASKMGSFRRVAGLGIRGVNV